MSEQVSGSVTLNSRQEESAQAKTWAVALVLLLHHEGWMKVQTLSSVSQAQDSLQVVAKLRNAQSSDNVRRWALTLLGRV
jgi:hypothetical protein